MEYVTFEYYKKVFGGVDVTEVSEFNSLLLKAQLEYDNYTMKPKLTHKLLEEDKAGANAIKVTLCEMIDNLKRGKELLQSAYSNDLINAVGITSEGVKDHSVNLKTSDTLKSNDIKKEIELSNILVMRKYLLRYGLLYRGLRP